MSCQCNLPQLSSDLLSSPIITFIIILLLPTLLTFITLLINRVRAARAAERDRAPEEVVHRLPWRVWTGTRWEKHVAALPQPEDALATDANRDLERGGLSEAEVPVIIVEEEEPEWVDKQDECAICLENFVKGDKVRELPCGHIFHIYEIDEWLITKKKLVCIRDFRPLLYATHHEYIVPHM